MMVSQKPWWVKPLPLSMLASRMVRVFRELCEDDDPMSQHYGCGGIAAEASNRWAKQERLKLCAELLLLGYTPQEYNEAVLESVGPKWAYIYSLLLDEKTIQAWREMTEMGWGNTNPFSL